MDIFNIIAMIGGLALFLFGMHMLGEGLSKLSGGRLEKILEKLTSSPIKAVLLGAGVTAVIQSSSATTVMVVGFVNSGLMKLEQAVGIIMGANIGTTVTSWILSLTGIESSNFFIKLCKPSSFTPIMALVGVIFIMFSHREKRRDIGTILIGFAVLIYGMDAMSAAVKPLADIPEFTNILLMFKNPILGMLLGALLTAVIQSSSASVGILQALATTGTMQFSVIVPIIMGQNIGTCVTAMISSIGANKNAKKTAFIHLYFNLIGTIIFMVVFYALNFFVDFAFMEKAANAFDIAIVHTLFNIFATLLLLPFSKLLVKLANLTVKSDEKEIKLSKTEKIIKSMDDRFLDSPSLAINHCAEAAYEMAHSVKESFQLAMEVYENYSQKKVQKIIDLESQVDLYEDALGTYLVKLGSKKISERDSQTVSVLLHTIGDFERISDHAVNLAYSAKEVHEKGMEFSKKAKEELNVLLKAVQEIITISVVAFDTNDLKLATNVEPLEEVIDKLNVEMKNRHIRRLRKGKCTIEMGFVLSDVTTSLERIADHCSNVAVCLLQINEESYETHEYLETLKQSKNEEFKMQINFYEQKYSL